MFLGSTTRENFVRTRHEGLSGKDCDVLAAIELWTSGKFPKDQQSKKESISKPKKKQIDDEIIDLGIEKLRL